jgi:beta-xylosidase
MTTTRLLFAGDYPDPSIVRVGETHYITHSSFLYHLGLLIWESKDLSTWRPVGPAVDQPGWDIWAPELAYYDGRFYLYYYARATTGDKRGTNWVVHAPSAHGPWSTPLEIPVQRIDPGHVVGPDGKRYLHFSGGTAAPLAADGLSLTGKLEQVYEGWSYPEDWRVEGFFVEGPKLLLLDGWYYLISAQGGTAGPATSHMAVVARSRWVYRDQPSHRRRKREMRRW